MIHYQLEHERNKGRGVYNIDYNINLREPKSSRHIEMGLVYDISFVDFLITNSSFLSEIVSKLNISKKELLTIKEIICQRISERILNLKFDYYIIDLIIIENKIQELVNNG